MRPSAADLHATGNPIAWSEHHGGFWVIGSWDGVNRVGEDWESFTSYNDLEGTGKEARMTGIWATCVQHEIDHLNGKLFIDYLGPMRRQMITARMKKLKRERARV